MDANNKNASVLKALFIAGGILSVVSAIFAINHQQFQGVERRLARIFGAMEHDDDRETVDRDRFSALEAKQLAMSFEIEKQFEAIRREMLLHVQRLTEAVTIRGTVDAKIQELRREFIDIKSLEARMYRMEDVRSATCRE